MVKKVLFILIIVIAIFTFSSEFKAVQATSIRNIINGADKFVDDGEGAENTIDMDMLDDTSGLIYNTLLIIGTCIAVIIGAVLGLQFITGSVEQKVKIKESILPYIIGCVVLFSAFGIWKLVIELLK